MKIIDEKGRLFGKINIIDFLVISFLLCLIPMFYFGVKIFTKKPSMAAVKEEFSEEEIYCKLIKVKPEILGSIMVGDKEFDINGSTVGEITWLGPVMPYRHVFDIGTGKVESKEDAMLKELPARLKVKANTRGNSLYYGDKQIMVNSPIEFKTDKYTISIVPDIEKIESVDKAEKIEKIDLFVTLKKLDENVIKSLAIGDKEVDERGNVIAEILNIGDMENDAYEISLGGGNFVLGEDSTKKQISTKMRLLVKIKYENQIYFKDQKVASNVLFEFRTNKYTAVGKISRTYDAPPALPKEIGMLLNVKFSGVIPEAAKLIAEGDIEKGPFGKTVGMLREIKSNKPSDVLSMNRNKFITLSHPFQRDITVTMYYLCVDKDGIPFFKNYPVRVGNAITFTTDLYSLSGVITGMDSE